MRRPFGIFSWNLAELAIYIMVFLVLFGVAWALVVYWFFHTLFNL